MFSEGALCFIIVVLSADFCSGYFCQEKVADIVFVLDSSTSIWEHDFERQIKFVEEVTGRFNIGENDVRVGVLTFSHELKVNFNLKDHLDEISLIHAIRRIEYMNGGTYTSQAIEYARKRMFLPENGGRPWATHIIIVITDGMSHNSTATIYQSGMAQYEGIQVFAIGVGHGVEQRELNGIGSRPGTKYVFQVNDYRALQSVKKSLVARACNEKEDFEVNDAPHVEIENLTKQKEDFEVNDAPHVEIENLTKRCGGKPADIYFLLDASSSIWKPNFEKQLAFVSSMVDTFDIGPDKARVGVVAFSDDVHPVVELGEFYNTTLLKERINNTPYYTGGTDTAAAIKYVKEKGFGSHHSRRGVAHIAIVLTDGQSRFPKKTSKAAKHARRAGIYIFSVGIGKDADMEELKDISSDPDESYVFRVSSYGLLETIRTLLVTKTCDVPLPRDQSGCTVSRLIDIMAVYDSTRRNIHNKISSSLHRLLKGFHDSDEKIKMGVLRDVCEESETTTHPLNHLTDGKAFVENLQNIYKTGLDRLLHKMRRHWFKKTHGGRKNADKIALLFLDEKIENLQEVILEAKRAKRQKITIYVVVIGNAVSGKTLFEIASRPFKDHVFFVQSEKQINNFHKQFTRQLCL